MSDLHPSDLPDRRRLLLTTGLLATAIAGAGVVNLGDMSAAVAADIPFTIQKISSGSIDDYLGQGVIAVNSSQVKGMPVSKTGWVISVGDPRPGFGYCVQLALTWETIPQLYVRRKQNTAFQPWSSTSLIRSALVYGEDLLARANNVGIVDVYHTNIVNGPGVTGTLIILPGNQFLFMTREPTPRILNNTLVNGAWTGWSSFSSDGAAVPAPTLAATGIMGIEHLMREQGLRERVGRISTNNRAAVCIIFDHGTDKFSRIVLPQLRKYGIRATLALNASMFEDPHYMHRSTNGAVTWSTIRGWAINDDLEIANHGMTHLGQSGVDAITREIVGGREALESALSIPIDSWVQYGIQAGQPDLDGFGVGLGRHLYWSTLAGKLIVDSHACATGSIPHSTSRYPLDGTIPLGCGGRWMDGGNTAIDDIKTRINLAVTNKERICLRMHPSVLDIGTNLSSSTFASFMNWLGQRNNNDLVILPFREWCIATI